MGYTLSQFSILGSEGTFGIRHLKENLKGTVSTWRLMAPGLGWNRDLSRAQKEARGNRGKETEVQTKCKGMRLAKGNLRRMSSLGPEKKTNTRWNKKSAQCKKKPTESLRRKSPVQNQNCGGSMW